MPRGSKEKYTDKQNRQAEYIEEGYKERGIPEDEAERRAWATVNKTYGGGEKPGGGGYGRGKNLAPARKGGRLGGRAAATAPSPRGRPRQEKPPARGRGGGPKRACISTRFLRNGKHDFHLMVILMFVRT